MDILNLVKLDEISTKLDEISTKLDEISTKIDSLDNVNEPKIKVPKAPLTFKFSGETDPNKTGIRYLTTGWHDKKLYGIARLKIFKANQVDDPATWEMGVNLPTTIYETILHLHVSNKGIVLITKKNGENPKVWYMQDIYTEPILMYEFVFTPATDTLHVFNITGHSDGVNDYLIACQYGHGFHTRNMYFSKDMGSTWTVINESIITNDSDVNSHWHTAKFDPYMGRIWAAEGDNSNSAISYSDDFGETWTRLPGRYQPTLIHPFPKRVIFGRDRGSASPGLDQWVRSSKPFALEDLTDGLTFRRDKKAYVNYPSMQITGYGDEAYIRFPKHTGIDEQYIYATGDGGESWHCVYSSKQSPGDYVLGNPSGVTVDGKIAFALHGYGTGDYNTPLVYSDAIEWV